MIKENEHDGTSQKSWIELNLIDSVVFDVSDL